MTHTFDSTSNRLSRLTLGQRIAKRQNPPITAVLLHTSNILAMPGTTNFSLEMMVPPMRPPAKPKPAAAMAGKKMVSLIWPIGQIIVMLISIALERRRLSLWTERHYVTTIRGPTSPVYLMWVIGTLESPTQINSISRGLTWGLIDTYYIVLWYAIIKLCCESCPHLPRCWPGKLASENVSPYIEGDS